MTTTESETTTSSEPATASARAYNPAAFRRTAREARDARPMTAREATWEREQVRLGDADKARLMLLPVKASFFMNDSHFVAKMPQVCTAKYPVFEGKCSYCYYDKMDKELKLNISSSPVLQVIDFRYFHRVLETRKGKEVLAIKNCTSSQPTPAANTRGRGCPWCASEKESERIRTFAGHRYWSLYMKDFNALTNLDFQCQQTCTHQEADGTRCMKSTFVIGYKCYGCGAEKLSERDLKVLTSEEEAKFAREKSTCKSCNESTYSDPEIVCESDAHPPVLGSMFDRPIDVACSVDVTGPKKKYTYTMTLGDWSSINAELAKHGIVGEEAAQVQVPWQLQEKFTPEFVFRKDGVSDVDYVKAVLESQAKKLGREMPYKDLDGGAPEANPAFRKYNKK